MLLLKVLLPRVELLYIPHNAEAFHARQALVRAAKIVESGY